MQLPVHKIIAVLFVLLSATFTFAQMAEVSLATAKGLTFGVGDLSAEGQKLHAQTAILIAQNRQRLRDEMVFDILLGTEAKTRGTTAKKIKQEATAKVQPPSEVQIKAVYEANRQANGNRTIDQMRKQIVNHLRQESEEKALAALTESLKIKLKYIAGKDNNTGSLKPVDVVATIAGKPITVRDFEEKHKIELYDFRANINEQITADLEDAITTSLINAEAKEQNIDATSLIAREITNKLRDYSDYERASLESALKKRLFTKYNVKFLTPELEPLVLNVSADDDPAIGNASAKVTVVAFVDFQCSACASVSPILKQVVSEFGNEVRLVVRDFPLTGTHENAFIAALAANAARNQGKFFEMADLMYRNQDALDLDSLKRYAGQLGLNIAQFERDMTSETSSAEVRKDIADGTSYGINGTPTIFVNGVKIYRLSAEKFRDSIEKALKR